MEQITARADIFQFLPTKRLQIWTIYSYSIKICHHKQSVRISCKSFLYWNTYFTQVWTFISCKKRRYVVSYQYYKAYETYGVIMTMNNVNLVQAVIYYAQYIYITEL